MGGLVASTMLGCSQLPPQGSRGARGAEGRAVRLVFYTDVHARTEWETPRAMALAADAINAQRADLVLAGGDLITDGFQSSAATVAPRWDAYMAMHEAIKPSVRAAIGNHDLVAAIPQDGSSPSANPRAVFLEKMGLERTYRSFEALGYHFVLLDSVEVVGGDLKYQGRIDDEQLEWLRRDLDRLPPNRPVVVVLHIPLLTTFYAATRGATTPAPANRVVTNNHEVLKILKDYNVVLVLQGHLHVREQMHWRNTTFITGGAICGQWWRGPWYGAEEGFNVVTLRQDRVEWDYIDYGWKARRPQTGFLRADDTVFARL